MPTDGKIADETFEEVAEIYKRAFSCLHIVETSGCKRDPISEIHRTSLMFSRILGHSYKKGLLDEKTLNELLIDMGSTP